jgi:hypothetical protein
MGKSRDLAAEYDRGDQGGVLIGGKLECGREGRRRSRISFTARFVSVRRKIWGWIVEIAGRRGARDGLNFYRSESLLSGWRGGASIGRVRQCCHFSPRRFASHGEPEVISSISRFARLFSSTEPLEDAHSDSLCVYMSEYIYVCVNLYMYNVFRKKKISHVAW